MSGFRQSTYCSELDRTPEELCAFADIPHAQRVYRFATHTRQTAQDYIRDCARYARWCGSNDHQVFSRSPRKAARVLYLYLQDCVENEGVTPISAIGSLTSLNSWYYTREYERPHSRELSGYCLSLRKQHQTVRATPASTEQIKRMCRLAMRCEPVRAARDIAMILYAFTSAKRPKEICALQFASIHFEARGMYVLIPSSKGDQEGGGQYVTITPAWDPEFCPVLAIRRWLEIGGITEGHVFRSINRWGKIGPDKQMHHKTYQRIMQAYARAVGLTGKVTGYSFRRGYATEATNRGASRQDVKTQLRHKLDSTTAIYVDQLPVSFERSLTPLLLS